nr:M20 family peptidase [Candidatus Undinarchaeales archaeon ERR594346 U_76725]
MKWDLNFERLEEDLFSLIEIPSVSGNEQAISNFILSTLKKSGLKAEQ